MDVAGIKTTVSVAFVFGPDCLSESNFISQLFKHVLAGAGKQSSADRK